ncbi:MAG: hypothetical protein GSR84_06950 [Desulfurococcales archaeon]|nr:hypothetical protein [Desulfurococcales archaeon]
MYQLGNLLLYMLTGETVDGEEAADRARVWEALQKVEDNRLRLVIGKMLALEPEERPSMEQAITMLHKIYLEIE